MRVAVGGRLGGADGQQVEDAGRAETHLVTAPADQGAEVHLCLGSELDHTLTSHHQHLRLLKGNIIKLLLHIIIRDIFSIKTSQSS